MNGYYYVYILASKKNGTLYTGVTNNLSRRYIQHNANINEGFTNKYNVHILIYFEWYTDIRNAIKREKQLKKWKREWKIALIEKENMYWDNLFDKYSD